MKQLRFFALTLLVMNSFAVLGQSGGNSVYSFLNLQGSAHVAALGGNAITSYDEDLSLVYQNPALLQRSMHNHLALNIAGIKGGIKFGDVAYARSYDKAGVYAVNLHYISYGEFDRRTIENEKVGEFSAGEYALSFSWSKPLDSNLFIGASLKGIFSDFDESSSAGIGADVGLTWIHKENGWTASIVAKNMGAQISTYYDEREKLPFEIQAGISKKLKNAPFRLTLIAQQLQKWDITYKDPSASTIDPLTGEQQVDDITFFDKLTRHLILNTEIIFSKGFQLRLGYNFLRRAELGFEQRRGMAGFTGGFGVKVNRFQLSYARSVFNRAGGINNFSIATNLSSF
jgi:hypothetical protein